MGKRTDNLGVALTSEQKDIIEAAANLMGITPSFLVYIIISSCTKDFTDFTGFEGIIRETPKRMRPVKPVAELLNN